MFSTRTGLDRSPNALARAVARRRARGAPLLDLTASNPTRAPGLPAAPLARRLGATGDAAGRYDPTPLGPPPARRAVAEELGHLDGDAPDPDDVVLTASTSEAYAALFTILGDPGDAVLAPRPSYPLFEHLARFAGLRVVPFDLVDEGAGRWRVDPTSLRAAADDGRARAVLAVSPNNPTGSFLHPEDLAALAGPGLPLIVDEVFRGYPLRGAAPPVPSAAVAVTDVPVVTLGGASKHLALPQAKVAWLRLGGPRRGVDELRGRLELVLDATLALATPTALALPRLLEDGRQVREALRARLLENLASARALARDTAVTVTPPEGGWYVLARLPRTRDDDAWAHALLEEDGVCAQPGWLYDLDPGAATLVLSLLPEPATFAEGVRRLVARAADG